MSADPTRYRLDWPEVYIDGYGRIAHGEPLPAQTSAEQLAGLITDRAVTEAS